MTAPAPPRIHRGQLWRSVQRPKQVVRVARKGPTGKHWVVVNPSGTAHVTHEGTLRKFFRLESAA